MAGLEWFSGTIGSTVDFAVYHVLKKRHFTLWHSEMIPHKLLLTWGEMKESRSEGALDRWSQWRALSCAVCRESEHSWGRENLRWRRCWRNIRGVCT